MSDPLYSSGGESRHLIRDMPYETRPQIRLAQSGAKHLSDAELLAVVLQSADGLDLAYDVLSFCGGVSQLPRASIHQLQTIPGIGPARAAQIVAAAELGRRIITKPLAERTRVSSPADAANLLMSEMMHLEKEELRVILMDTRNGVLGIPTVYVGSLNTSMVRVCELFRPAIAANAAAILVVHNHPSGHPDPSPEDAVVTKQIVESGKLLDIDVLDHVIIGHQRFVSLRERGLGGF